MDILANERNPNVPNCEQIRRACNMPAGVTPEQMMNTFKDELNAEGVYLAWCARKAFDAVDEKMNAFHAEQKRQFEAEQEAHYDSVLARAERYLAAEKKLKR